MRLALTAFMFTAMLFARADDSAVRKALSDRYGRYDKATIHGMEALAKWCEEYFAPDCTIQAGGKTMTGKQFIEMCRTMAKNPDPTWGGIKKQKVSIDQIGRASWR